MEEDDDTLFNLSTLKLCGLSGSINVKTADPGVKTFNLSLDVFLLIDVIGDIVDTSTKI